MDPKIKNYLGWASLVAIVVLIGSSIWFVSAYSRSVPPSASFQVTGEGRKVAVPDRAEFSFGLTTEGGRNIASLQKENSDKINSMLDFVKSAGVDSNDIRTANYNISPRYQYFSCPPVSAGAAKPCPPSEIVGYTVNQTITLKVRDFSKIGDIMTGVANRGANNVSGLQFTLHDRDAAENDARAEAMVKAKAKAEAFAAAGGFRLGRLLSIQESGGAPVYYAQSYGLMGKGGGAVAAPAPDIQAGSDEIVKNITLIYEIL